MNRHLGSNEVLLRGSQQRPSGLHFYLASQVIFVWKVCEASASSQNPAFKHYYVSNPGIFSDLTKIGKLVQACVLVECLTVTIWGCHTYSNLTVSLTKVYIICSQFAAFLWIGNVHLVSWAGKKCPTVTFHPARKYVTKEWSFILLTLGTLFWALWGTHSISQC